MSASGYIFFRILASSKRTFLTINFWVVLGKNCSSSLVVIQAPAFVMIAEFLYLIESKKLRSFSLAFSRGFISLILKFFFKLIFEYILLIFIFFFLKKIF